MNDLTADEMISQPDNPYLEQIREASQKANAMAAEIRKVVIGQDKVIQDVLIVLLAAGHVLIEGVPGLGKTLLVRALAKCFNGDFSRIQFTPDLMPSDVTGHAVYDLKSEQFKIQKGPVFTNLLLADEINRAPAKTQSALLEVMQEQQVTIEGRPFATGSPFMVLATQNPIEQEGTYPLPEAELDRFMMKIRIDYPDLEQEKTLVALVTDGKVNDTLNVSDLNSFLSSESILEMQKLVSLIPMDEKVLDYTIRLVRATREWAGIFRGVGPRGSIALVRAARAHALLRGGEFVIPDDVKSVALSGLRHRITLSAELEIEGYSPDQVLMNILDKIEAPRV